MCLKIRFFRKQKKMGLQTSKCPTCPEPVKCPTCAAPVVCPEPVVCKDCQTGLLDNYRLLALDMMGREFNNPNNTPEFKEMRAKTFGFTQGELMSALPKLKNVMTNGSLTQEASQAIFTDLKDIITKANASSSGAQVQQTKSSARFFVLAAILLLVGVGVFMFVRNKRLSKQ